jgi:hypothetical protein
MATQLYLVQLDFQDVDYTPVSIDLKAGDVVELDDATANHINRKQNATVTPYVLGETDGRAVEAAPHDRMQRGKSTRDEPPPANFGAIARDDFKATKDKKK